MHLQAFKLKKNKNIHVSNKMYNFHQQFTDGANGHYGHITGDISTFWFRKGKAD